MEVLAFREQGPTWCWRAWRGRTPAKESPVSHLENGARAIDVPFADAIDPPELATIVFLLDLDTVTRPSLSPRRWSR